MEPIHGTRTKASKFSPEEKDVINSMPNNVITTILNRLPIQDAVRTGILSRDWRFNWTTMLTQLVFDRKFFWCIADKQEDGRTIISRLLLQLKGAITVFRLCIDDECYFEDINSWVMFLSEKGIEDFTLSNIGAIQCMLPTHLFSCLNLKRLVLHHCRFPPMPCGSVCGFPHLLSLDLYNVRFESQNCGEFLTQSPLLEIARIHRKCVTGVMKQDEIAKLENLKVLLLPLCKFDSKAVITSSTIFQLMGVFSKLQELSLNFRDCKLLTDAEMRVLTPLPCLKILNLLAIDFCSDIMVSCAIELISGCPNLQTLMLVAIYKDAVPPPTVCSSGVDFSRIGQLQLQNVQLLFLRGLENDVCLVKSLLASSPFLKRMYISADSSEVFGGDHGDRMFASKLLKFHRASPIAEIDLDWI